MDQRELEKWVAEPNQMLEQPSKHPYYEQSDVLQDLFETIDQLTSNVSHPCMTFESPAPYPYLDSPKSDSDIIKDALKYCTEPSQQKAVDEIYLAASDPNFHMDVDIRDSGLNLPELINGNSNNYELVNNQISPVITQVDPFIDASYCSVTYVQADDERISGDNIVCSANDDSTSTNELYENSTNTKTQNFNIEFLYLPAAHAGDVQISDENASWDVNCNSSAKNVAPQNEIPTVLVEIQSFSLQRNDKSFSAQIDSAEAPSTSNDCCLHSRKYKSRGRPRETREIDPAVLATLKTLKGKRNYLNAFASKKHRDKKAAMKHLEKLQLDEEIKELESTNLSLKKRKEELENILRLINLNSAIFFTENS